jgi:hypothetical protein
MHPRLENFLSFDLLYYFIIRLAFFLYENAAVGGVRACASTPRLFDYWNLHAVDQRCRVGVHCLRCIDNSCI